MSPAYLPTRKKVFALGKKSAETAGKSSVKSIGRRSQIPGGHVRGERILNKKLVIGKIADREIADRGA
jgi:hypothetical protein